MFPGANMDSSGTSSSSDSCTGPFCLGQDGGMGGAMGGGSADGSGGCQGPFCISGGMMGGAGGGMMGGTGGGMMGGGSGGMTGGSGGGKCYV